MAIFPPFKKSTLINYSLPSTYSNTTDTIMTQKFEINDVVKIINDDSFYLIVSININTKTLFLKNPNICIRKYIPFNEITNHYKDLK